MDAMVHRDDLAPVDARISCICSRPGSIAASWCCAASTGRRRRIILEKIIRYEAVHEIRDWDDLRRRIDPPDRRCYAFFHPALVDEPLIFVEVALTDGIPGAIAPILAASDGSTLDAGATRHGGVLFDLELPARARRRLLRQLPDQAGGRGDLARIPQALDLRDALAGAGLCRLARARAQERAARIAADAGRPRRHCADLDEPKAGGRIRRRASRCEEPLLRAAATYFLHARNAQRRAARPGRALPSRQRRAAEQLNFLGDLSEKGLAQSHGLMVNYLYDLDDIEKNHEAFAENRTSSRPARCDKLVRVRRPTGDVVPLVGKA